MNKISFIIIFILIIAIPTYIVFSDNNYISETSILEFSKNSPTLLSILLASVLASLVIIIGMLGLDELEAIQNLEASKNKKIFNNMIRNLSWDIFPILIAFIVSSFLSIFSISKTFLILPIGEFSVEIYKLIFVVNFVLLSVSLIAAYDMIQGLLDICRIKYQSIKKKS